MKTINWLVLLCFIIVWRPNGVYGFTFANLETYKLDLEKHIDSKIRQAVKPMLTEDQYSLSVAVELKSTAEINKLFPQTEPVKKDPQTIGEDRAEEFTFVDTKPDEAEVLLPLTKLGLWQRKVAKEKKAENESPSGTNSNIVSYRDLVAGIAVTMFVDKKLSVDVNDTIERVVRGVVPANDNRVNFQFGKLTIPEKAPPPGTEVKNENSDKKDDKESNSENKDKKQDAAKERTWLDYLVEFKMPLALLLCTLTLFGLGLVITSNMNKLSVRKMNMMEKQAEREDAAFKAAQMREDEMNSRTQNPINDLDEKELDKKRPEIKTKFLTFVDERPRDAVLMLRRWILFGGEGATESLNLCARWLTVNQISGLLDLMNDNERRSWNRLVNRPFTQRDEKIAVLFIESQMLVNLIQAVPNVESDLKETIYKLDLNEIVTIIKKNQELGSVLLLFLQSAQLAKVFEVLDVDLISRVSQIAVQFSPMIIESKAKELSSLIDQVRSQIAVRSPFIDRLQGLLQEVAPEKEGPLFYAMATQLDRKAFLDFARTHLPAELVPRIPVDLLRKTLSSMSLVRRAELILSQENDKRDFLISLIGEGKAREILMEEIDTISLEAQKLSLLKRNGEGYWRQFVQSVRQQTSDEARRGDLDEFIGAWIDSLAQRGRSNARRAA